MHGPPSKPNVPGISIQMTDRDIIDRVAAMFQSKVSFCRRQQPHHKDYFALYLRGERSIRIMKLVRPFMGIRRGARIDEVIARFRPNPKHYMQRKFPSQEQLQKTYDQVKSLRKVAKKFGVSHQYVSQKLGRIAPRYKLKGRRHTGD